MGLLEKAFKYKNKITSGGGKTLMDTITGPADTGRPYVQSVGGEQDDGTNEDILYLDKDDLAEVGGDHRHTPDPERKEDEVKTRRNAAAVDEGPLLDNLSLYELSKDILHPERMDELFDVILFSIMGQVGVTSSSIMLASDGGSGVWRVAESRGVTINRDEDEFYADRGILKELIARRDIIDVEEFKDKPMFSDDYIKYVGIDARLLVPMVYRDAVVGVITLGNKLNGEDYTGEEKGFFNVIATYAAISYRALRYKELSESGTGAASHIAALEGMRSRLRSEPTTLAVRRVVQEEFRAIGISGFAVYIQNSGCRDYRLFVCDPDDRLRLADLQPRITADSGLIREIAKAESPVIFNDFRRSRSMVEIFTDRQLKEMEQCDLYTLSLGGDLVGFTMIYALAREAIPEKVIPRMLKFSDIILPYLAVMSDIEYRRGSYIDTIEGILNRVDDECANARGLNIPVTLILFSIKNLKRYYALFGREKEKEIFSHFESFVKSRISERDFSARFDRNKILLVLPGKDRSYAVPLAGTICTEMSRKFGTRDFQLLVTHLTAEFPADGNDAHTLLDAMV